MTAPLTEIHDAVHEWLQRATGLADGSIIPANDGMSPEPTGDYISINIIPDLMQASMMDEIQYTATGEYTVKGHRTALVSLNSYGPNSYVHLSTAKAVQDAPSIRTLFADALLVLVECRNVRDLSSRKGQRLENRSQMDCLVRYAMSFTDDVNYVETIDYTINAVENDGETIEDSVTDSVAE